MPDGPPSRGRRTFLLGSLAALLGPGAALAQPAQVRRVGVLGSSTEDTFAASLKVFRAVLRELGWIEGQNLTIEARFARERYDQLPDLAAGSSASTSAPCSRRRLMNPPSEDAECCSELEARGPPCAARYTSVYDPVPTTLKAIVLDLSLKHDRFLARRAKGASPMESTRNGWALATVLLIGLADARSCFGAEEQMKLKPGALRPPGTVTVIPTVRLDASKKVFVRLTGPGEPRDLPVDAGPASRLQITLPKETRQGRYTVELVSESGDVLAKGGRFRILATEVPVITKVVPHPSYAVDGTYSFEVLGENFGHDAEDTTLRINDVPIHFPTELTDRRRTLSVTDCRGKMPCLIGNRRSLHIHGLALDKRFSRPTNVSVEVDSLVSTEKTLLLSWAQRSTPQLIAFVALGILAGVVFLMVRPTAAHYRPQGKRYNTFAYLLIDPATNTYSLSLFQLLLWTAAAVVAYVYLATSQSLVQWKWQLPNIPEGLPTLLGLSVGTTALAIGATETRGGKGAGPVHPGFGDFVTTGGLLAPERLQFFLWTVIGVCGFVSATLAQDPATLTELPKIPDNFLPLMGVSALGYLAGKVVRKPGPVIKQLEPAPPYLPGSPPTAGIRIVGENLSPRAQVRINGELIPTGAVTVGPSQSPAAEFVTELAVTPTATATALAAVAARPAAAAAAPPTAPAAAGAPRASTGPAMVGVPAVKVVNPDGQSADQ